MKKGKLIYCIVFFFICLLPFVGIKFSSEEESSENRTLAKFPSLMTEEGINREWLLEAGDYFQDHFAFRNTLVTANAVLNGKIFGVSSAAGVIQGTEGWLYYKDSLADYQGTDLLSDRSIFNISHTLSMMQAWLNKKGINFAFTVAPNKNSLYDENMPYYYGKKASEEKNILRLAECVKEEGVSYVDLYSVFSGEDEVLYHMRDSHWNNKGAAMAADRILSALKKEHDSYENEPYEVRKDFVGDLDKMLYPSMTTPEDEIYYEKAQTFAYIGEPESNFDPKISTVNPTKEGSLVMYRDSFGNAILPFMADAYEQAYFSRGVPYQLNDVFTTAADTVVVERAERFLPDMAQAAPVMEATAILPESLMEEIASDGVLDLKAETIGSLIKITGRIKPEYMTERAQIYIRTNQAGVYEAFPVDVELNAATGETDENGFCMYLNPAGLKPSDNVLEVAVKDQDGYRIIFKDEMKENL